MKSKTKFGGMLMAAIALLFWAMPASAQLKGDLPNMTEPPSSVQPSTLKAITVVQKLDGQVPLDLQFHDEAGNAVRLGSYFGARPVILNLAYYQCQMLCGEVQNGLVGSLKALKFDVGRDFDIVTVSFDPRETPAMALDKKKSLLQRYRRAGADQGWHVLTGDQTNIEALTRSVGYEYRFDAKSGQWAHAAAIVLLTPQGRISRYFYGVEFSPKDLRLGLIEASQNRIGTAVDQLVLYCFHYDPATGKYGAVIMNVLRLAGAATALILGAFVFIMFRRDPSSTGKPRIG